MVSTDLLILLSDVDGLYTNPISKVQHVPEIQDITPEILAMGGNANAEFASGGMATKLTATRIASAAGIGMIICKGFDDTVSALIAGAKCSFFRPQTSLIKTESWIAGADRRLNFS